MKMNWDKFYKDYNGGEIHKEHVEFLLQSRVWQPIGTAPEDEAVLVCFGTPFFGTFAPAIEVGYLDSESGTWRFNLNDKVIGTNGVTGWMHLPEAPKQDDKYKEVR